MSVNRPRFLAIVTARGGPADSWTIDLGDQLGPHPMHTAECGEPKRLVRGGGTSIGILSGASGWSRRHSRSISACLMPVPARPA